MLKLVLGGSGSGKTTLLYARIRARAEQGLRSILLVPEQFTSSTEGRIYRELGDALSGMVESFSFTSLAEHILSTEGGAAVQTLSDAGRAVLVRRALEELQDNVHYYYRHRRSAAFCQMAAQTIDELKSAGLSLQTGWNWLPTVWKPPLPGGSCQNSCRSGRCSLTNLIPSTPPKSG